MVRFFDATRDAGLVGTRSDASFGVDFPGGATTGRFRTGDAAGSTLGLVGFATTTFWPCGVVIVELDGGLGTSADRICPGVDLMMTGSAATACKKRVPDVRAKSMTRRFGLFDVAGRANAW